MKRITGGRKMAKEIKNKVSKCWISEDREFWGPVAIALGFTALLNGAKDLFDLLIAPPTPINGWINPLMICINLLFGLAFIVFGIWAIRAATPRTRNLWARIDITAGFAIFFFGTRIVSSNLIMFIVGWLIIASSLGLIGRGFYLYFRDKKRQQG
jgi:hypothetical protein